MCFTGGRRVGLSSGRAQLAARPAPIATGLVERVDDSAKGGSTLDEGSIPADATLVRASAFSPSQIAYSADENAVYLPRWGAGSDDGSPTASMLIAVASRSTNRKESYGYCQESSKEDLEEGREEVGEEAGQETREEGTGEEGRAEEGEEVRRQAQTQRRIH